MSGKNVLQKHAVEDLFKGYALIVDVDNVQYRNAYRIFHPEFFVIGLNDKNEWFDVDIFCFDGQPIAKDLFALQDPDAPLPRFMIDLNKATKAGVHRVDLLMALDLEDPQSLENVQNISYHFQDSTGRELDLTQVPVDSKHNHFTGVMLSFRLENGSWTLSPKAETYPHDISEMIMEVYHAVEGDDGSFEPNPSARPSPKINLVGFDKPKPVESNKASAPTQDQNKSAKVTVPLNEPKSAVKRVQDIVVKPESVMQTTVISESSGHSRRKSDSHNSPSRENTASVQSAEEATATSPDLSSASDLDAATLDTILEQGVDIFGGGEVVSAEHETHPLRNVDFSMIHLDSTWVSERGAISVRRGDEQFKIGREHRLIDVDNILKNPSPHIVFQVPEVIASTITLKN